ncbi:MAG: sulfotransferase [Candidatus Binatia bacterium]
MSDTKCIIILSEKSSGSSAIQNLLAQSSRIQHIGKSRHFENETLYWTKAASVFRRPQLSMVDSNVPFQPERARAEMVALLNDNLADYSAPSDDRELVFGGWGLLCKRYSPIFIEKSPHHLCQWSALELIMECINELDYVEFLLVGLIRHPLDTLYSQFKRWRTRPEDAERQWIIAYQNLLRLRGIMGNRLVVVRYEDMVSSVVCLRQILGFCDITEHDIDNGYLHRRALQRWRADPVFGFVLSDDASQLAEQYGYQGADLRNEPYRLWPIAREFLRTSYKTRVGLGHFVGRVGRPDDQAEGMKPN